MIEMVTLVQSVGYMSTQDTVIKDLLTREYEDPKGFVQVRHDDKGGFTAYEIDMCLGFESIRKAAIHNPDSSRRNELKRLVNVLETAPEGIDIVVITLQDI